ncbi:hypothetical protein NEUTE2DRAFT_51269 [Neurospora tetrasperma FGSC 2509]|nr:hypothetical protein NEUTE2DRAFT_51269 [Neurospora tetrasperma FGSC 2509]
MNNNADNELASLWERYRAAAFATGEDSIESIPALEHVAQHLRTKRHFSCAVCILEVAQTRCSMRYGPTADVLSTNSANSWMPTWQREISTIRAQATVLHPRSLPGYVKTSKRRSRRKAKVLDLKTAIKSHEDWTANRSEGELRAEVGDEKYEELNSEFQDNVRVLEMDREHDVCQQPGQCKDDDFEAVFGAVFIQS